MNLKGVMVWNIWQLMNQKNGVQLPLVLVGLPPRLLRSTSTTNLSGNV